MQYYQQQISQNGDKTDIIIKKHYILTNYCFVYLNGLNFINIFKNLNKTENIFLFGIAEKIPHDWTFAVW